MEYTQILVEKQDYVATITLNRPEHLNAFTWTMGDELIEALREIDADPDMRVTVVTGAGRAFCAGMDMSGGGPTSEESAPKSPEEIAEAANMAAALFKLKKPVIVAYNGPAVGVGVTMTLPLDIRIAAESARLGIVFVRRGLIPEVASPWLLPRIIGISRAAELMYTGRVLNAHEALEYGLVSRVVPDDELMPTVMEMANDIAVKCAPVCVALTKQMLYDFLGETDVEKVETINHTYLAWTIMQPDVGEGILSFLQKREPNWSMRVPDDMPEKLGD
jgi:enoyl-CoA hydratase/carnithine racemase